ncbi:MAG: response regulator transcription factor [Mobiluncus porci]|uniref:response regulator n=1 Tax=Mobiluncus porci TaxID=2652278 RepID=UPI0023F55719|nr:response regulator transcription factor [Mobiluncus porci]MDD7541910.1 response regulator transcription factor [Mobiluncus porci]MDY5749380.1 response regulator transcription factor [Mobiluncus porci]
MTTVLPVEDNSQIRNILKSYLERDHFDILETGAGNSAVAIARESTPDVILLDLGLPDLDGLEVMRQIRIFSDAFIIVISARSEEVDRLVGLSSGADDYVTKPFSAREVMARIQALLRRRSMSATPIPDTDAGETKASPTTPVKSLDSTSSETAFFGGITINSLTREVTRHGDPISLSALEFDLLWALS